MENKIVCKLLTESQLSEIKKIKDEYKKLHNDLDKKRKESLLMYERAENAIIEACNTEIKEYIRSLKKESE